MYLAVFIIVILVVSLLLLEFKMSIDNLNNSISVLSGNVDKLIAQEAGQVPQAQVDAAQVTVDGINAKVVAALTPAA